HRIQHLVRMAVQFERRVAVVGRSLQANFKTAKELGFLKVPEGLTVKLEDTDRVPPSKLLLLTAGSQGEPMSALARFAAQRHPFVNVLKDDWVVISARPIPGNERMVHQTVNNLYRHGARVFYSEAGNVNGVCGYRAQLARSDRAGHHVQANGRCGGRRNGEPRALRGHSCGRELPQGGVPRRGLKNRLQAEPAAPDGQTGCDRKLMKQPP